jgi:glutathione S-transferase
MRLRGAGAILVTMLELFQTEWCPASHRVRQRLTELGVDYVIRQAPVDPADRRGVHLATGSASIPAVRLEDGSAVVGERAIVDYLEGRFDEPAEAKAHRAKAKRTHRRYLEEECTC